VAESRRERKVVTVLFADLVGFTARAEELDPEDVEAILRPYHEALARGNYLAAADIYAEMGSLPAEAYARLRATAQLVAAGQRHEADRQLQPALAFWRSVSATRYVREAEALLPATA
jgi:hypothetical protein